MHSLREYFTTQQVCSFLFLSLSVSVSLICEPSALAEAPNPLDNVSSKKYGQPLTPSAHDHQTNFYSIAPHQRREDQSTIWKTQTPSGTPATFASSFQAAMTPTQTFSIGLAAPATYAQTPQQQAVPHAPFLQTGSRFSVNDPPFDADLSKYFYSQAAFQANAPTLGKTLSDTGTQASLISMTNQLIDMGTSPQAWDQASKGAMWAQAQNASDATASAAQNAFQSNTESLLNALPNVANEESGTPGAANAAWKPLTQALWMVQQMFKVVYLPMAILFVLTGAIVTQVKAYISYTAITSGTLGQSEDVTSGPFVGILRGMIAIFLIPATQLIVSYSIDIGNSMTYEVQSFINAATVVDWSKQETIASNTVNPGFLNPDSEFAKRTNGQTLQHLFFNGIDMLLNYGLMVLTAYQLVVVCYLFLLGPLAASFFAWPTGIGTLFKPIFGYWVDGLTILVLWRFWWCVILLCMCVRIEWLQQLGQYAPNSQWEQITYTAFMVMLTYVPFLPFDFRPGDLVETLLQKTGSAVSSVS
jgi:hypothetical protein